MEFWVKGLNEEAEINAVLCEKLREFGIEMPPFEGGSIENYLKLVAELSPKSINWLVRRQVAFGVFPSACPDFPVPKNVVTVLFSVSSNLIL